MMARVRYMVFMLIVQSINSLNVVLYSRKVQISISMIHLQTRFFGNLLQDLKLLKMTLVPLLIPLKNHLKKERMIPVVSSWQNP